MEKEILFDCSCKDKNWQGKIRFKNMSEICCVAEIEARGTSFLVVVARYYEGFGMKEYCMTECNRGFGCKLSSVSHEWNKEQFARYIKYKADIESLASGVREIVSMMYYEMNGKGEKTHV